MTHSAIILAAGYGTRMPGDKPKVLYDLAGRSLIDWVLDTASALDDTQIHVVGNPDHPEVQTVSADRGAQFHEQKIPRGTADAVKCAAAALDAERILILYGDVPLIRPATLQILLNALESSDLAVLSTELDDPTGYGRIVRDSEGEFVRIVEQRDATAAETQIREINTGILAAKGEALKGLLNQVQADNAQGEYYLTDCAGLARQAGLTVATQIVADGAEALGINTPVELERAERAIQVRFAEQLLQAGCLIRDKHRLDIRGNVQVGQDVEIDVNVLLIGDVALGDGVRIGANCVLKDVFIEKDTEVKPFSHIEAARIGKACTIGPYARIRPTTELADKVKIGNFVEVKQSVIGEGSKVNHLSYIGDSTAGKDVNVGAGTITCNYDGADKHRTTIDDDVFIGSGTQIVAPVKICRGATIGAGSTITRDAESDKLTLSRSPQKTVSHWQRPGRRDK